MEPDIKRASVGPSKTTCLIPMGDPNSQRFDHFVKTSGYDRNREKMMADPAYSSLLCKMIEVTRCQDNLWCKCSECESDPLVRQNVCCIEVIERLRSCDCPGIDLSFLQLFEKRMRAIDQYASTCICYHETFENIVLNIEALEIRIEDDRSFSKKKKLLVDRLLVEDKNRVYRYHAYRSFVLWAFGHLGWRRRVEMPSCVRKRIRETFPSDHYVGFAIPELDV